MARDPSADEFRQLLRDYNELPDERQRIVAEIERRFCHTIAILVVDTCGFSRRARASGIVHFLAHQERLERIIEPAFARYGGRLLRAEADNFFAVLPDTLAAVRCALEILDDVAVANEALPTADESQVSIGIGYGSVLDAGDRYLYGDEMNQAFKLGEDLARENEVLLTAAAHAALGASPWQFEEHRFSVAGITLTAHRLVTPR
jgi:class 3 adenylate cyclase